MMTNQMSASDPDLGCPWPPCPPRRLHSKRWAWDRDIGHQSSVISQHLRCWIFAIMRIWDWMTDARTLSCNISSHGQTPRHARRRAGPWCSPRAWPRPPRRSPGQCRREPHTGASPPPSASSGPWATWSSRGPTHRQGLQHEWMVLSWAFFSWGPGVSLFKINREGGRMADTRQT